ncbi:MAG TPA: glucodextranase DOMON-like domain-containing protein [Thermoplasmata archaeon]|nr:glucodextranase DOMON-like domain-containing protein [Thermoplasmata archaeon]
MSYARSWLGNSSHPLIRFTVAVALLVVVVMLFSSFSAALATTAARTSGVRAATPGPLQTPNTITFTGQPQTDFPADALLYTNLFTPWGASNNITGLYGTWDATNLYLGVSGINVSGNSFLFAISNDSSWGTTNLSNISGAGASFLDRTIDFTQPMNYLFVVNSSYILTSYAVTSKAGNGTTTVAALTPAAEDDTLTASGGNLEVALAFSAIFPGGFPDFANVSLYASVFGGSGSYVGPTIPSGQSYDVNYEPVYLTAHDLADGYLLENTFYQLNLDPQGLGAPDSGITPNYVAGQTFHTVTFTGSPSTDFLPSEQSLINTNTGWGSTNLLNSSYMTWNQTTLFLGVNVTIQGGVSPANHLGIFISNDSGSGLGTYNLSANNDPGLDHWNTFSQAVNFIAEVNYSGSSLPSSPVELFKVTSPAATSNTSVTVVNETGALAGSAVSAQGVELAIPFTLLYGSSAAWPVLGMFANLSMVTAIMSGTGNYTGPTLPAGQTSTNGYNPYHFLGAYDYLNTFYTQNLDPYGDGVPAAQISSVYTYGHTYHSVQFTGTPTKDFVSPEIVGTSNYTGWSSSNLINSTYATWNYTDLFIGTNSTVGGGNWFMVAISNNTGVGATNFSTTNVANLTRNFEFGTPVNWVFDYSGGAPNGSLYQVDLSGTTATSTQFTFVASIPAGTDGDEFAIPWTLLYPNQPGGVDAVPAGATPQLVALIYGGSGAYIGPTIPEGQQFSSGTAFAPISSFVSLGVDPNKDEYAEPGIVPGAPAISLTGAPISLNIIFNDHQPLYASIGGPYALAWTVVHLEEYAEQALIAGLYPNLNITYSLSGSLLYQILAAAVGDYNNSYLEAAYIPTSQWGNTVYTEVNTYGDTFLSSFVAPYQYNTTTVASLLEFDLAFNTPPWAYHEDNNASKLYWQLFLQYQAGKTLTTANLTDALVDFFLWSTSWPIETGQLGSTYIDPTMWALYNQTSFSISDLNTIQAYYPVEAQLVISAFSHDRMLNDGTGGNVELITTPFDHPILPLLLLGNWTDENGVGISKGVWANDTTAQLTIGAQLYQQVFGQAPLGLWSPEQAVSAATIPFIGATGYQWTSSSQAILDELGLLPSGSAGAVTPTQMETLYTPYKVSNGTQSTVMVFRDDGLSNDWGFNYGGVANTSGNWAAADQFMAYLKNIYVTVPRVDHGTTLVTMALDGENWMFMSPFPEDGIPFLEDVYGALSANSSWVQTTTTQQYLVTHPASTLPTITDLPTGSWNNEPTGNGINSYLGQWAGHGLQDAMWQQLALVRSEVQAYGTANDLSQPMTLAAFEAANNFPHLTEWNTTSAQDKYTQAWIDIYGAEGSDAYFAWDPTDQNPAAQNALVFESVLRSDLSSALTLLGLPLTPFLLSSYIVPQTPTTWGTNASVSPVLSGSLYTTESFSGGLGYSVNHNDGWAGAYAKQTGDSTSGAGQIAATYYAFDVSNLYFSVQVNGATAAYKAPNFYTPATDQIELFFSPVDPQAGDLQSLNVPNGVYTVGSTPFGFAATTEATLEGSSVTPSGSATLGVFNSAAGGTWVAGTPIVGDAFLGTQLQLQVPTSALGMSPGQSVEFFVAAVNGTTGLPISWSGPMIVTIPSSLAVLTPIATIHNTAADNGPGYYTMPTQDFSAGLPDFPPNSLQMTYVNVSDNPYTVQFNVTFAQLSNPFGSTWGFSQPVIDILIHEAGASGGSIEGIPGSNINVTSSAAWQWAIQASGFPASNFVQSATGASYPADVLVSSNTGLPAGVADGTIVDNATVSIQVPTALIGTTITTDTYVIVVGSQDGEGGVGDDWRAVDNVSSAYQGGGAPSTELGTSTNVYGYIAPAVVNSSDSTETQQALLNTFTKTQFAVLDGIQLPLLATKKVTVATLGPSAFVNTSGDPEAYYAFGSQLYSSSSTDGITWSTPVAGANLSFVPAGLAASGGSNPGLVAWNGTQYAFEDLTTSVVTSGTATGPIEAAAVTDASVGYELALDVGGTVQIVSAGGGASGSATLNALAVGLSTSGGTTYLAYATATGLSVVTLSFSGATVTFGASTVLSAAIPSGATVESLALAADPSGGVAVAIALKNTTGSNIYLAVGTGNVTLKALTSDGQDSSPSVVLGESGGTWSAYVGFTNAGGSGNVFFIPTAVGTVSTPPTTSSSPSTPTWVWIAIAVAIILVVIGAIVALSRRKQGGAPPTTGAGPGTGPQSTTSTSTTPSGDQPPQGGGGT